MYINKKSVEPNTKNTQHHFLIELIAQENINSTFVTSVKVQCHEPITLIHLLVGKPVAVFFSDLRI